MRRRAVVAVAVAVLGAGAWLGGPLVLRRLAFFRVREVELVGLVNLTPDAVLAALRLDSAASVFDDRDVLAARVRRLHGIADARVERRMPAALRVVVQEVDPAALVPGPAGMVVVDAAGRPLPFDP